VRTEINGEKLNGKDMAQFAALKINMYAMKGLLGKDDWTFDEFSSWIFTELYYGSSGSTPIPEPTEPTVVPEFTKE